MLTPARIDEIRQKAHEEIEFNASSDINNHANRELELIDHIDSMYRIFVQVKALAEFWAMQDGESPQVAATLHLASSRLLDILGVKK